MNAPWRHRAAVNRPPDMKINSATERVVHSQKMVLELLLADMPLQGASPYRLDSELDHWATKLNVFSPRFEPREPVAPDLSHPAIAVNLDACIQCTRCVRACREEQVNDVIGYAMRGKHSEIVFDMGDLMGESTCVALRRMRAGLSYRRPDAGQERGTGET